MEMNLLKEFAHEPDQEAGAADADEDAGDPAGGVDADKAAQPAAQGAAHQAHQDVAEQAAPAVHDLPGDPAHQPPINSETMTCIVLYLLAFVDCIVILPGPPVNRPTKMSQPGPTLEEIGRSLRLLTGAGVANYTESI